MVAFTPKYPFKTEVLRARITPENKSVRLDARFLSIRAIESV